MICAESTNHIKPELTRSLQKQSLAHEVIFSLNPERPERAQGMLKSQYELVFFLDQDCEVPSTDFLQKIFDFFKDHPDTEALLGHYESPPSLNLVARTYNKICKLWHLAEPQQNLLGGCFVLRNPRLMPSYLWEASAWGGEDAVLGKKLRALNYKMCSAPWFWVLHHDRGSLKKFFSRAWTHGKARKKFGLKNHKRFQIINTTFRALTWSEAILFTTHLLLVEISSFASGLKTPASSPKK